MDVISALLRWSMRGQSSRQLNALSILDPYHAPLSNPVTPAIEALKQFPGW